LLYSTNVSVVELVFSRCSCLENNLVSPTAEKYKAVLEKKILNMLDCPFLVKGYGVAQDEFHTFFLMEYIEGNSLLYYTKDENLVF
jgi:serine/threonine protein kinase